MTAQAFSNRKPLYYFLALALLVAAVELAVTHLPRFSTTPALPFAVTVDLVVGIPGLYYLFIVRPYKVGWFTVTGVFGLSMGLAALILPTGQQYYLGWFQKALLLAEPALLVLLVLRLRRLRREYRLAAGSGPDFMLNLEASFQAVLGHPLQPLVSEITLFRYGFLFWLARPAADDRPTFSMHQESAFGAILGTLLLVSVVEMGVVHLLLHRWSPLVANGLLGVSVYGLVFLLGHWQAVRQRPVLLTETALHLRIGLVWNFTLPLAALAAAQPWPDTATLPAGTLNLAKPLATPPNVLLTCHYPVRATGPYGLHKQARQLAVYVDQPADLLQALRPLA